VRELSLGERDFYIPKISVGALKALSTLGAKRLK